jgi:hypothetical protein
MRFGDLLELDVRFRERDVEDAFAVANAFEEKLQGEGGFAGAGIALDEVEVSLRISSRPAMPDLSRLSWKWPFVPTAGSWAGGSERGAEERCDPVVSFLRCTCLLSVGDLVGESSRIG